MWIIINEDRYMFDNRKFRQNYDFFISYSKRKPQKQLYSLCEKILHRLKKIRDELSVKWQCVRGVETLSNNYYSSEIFTYFSGTSIWSKTIMLNEVLKSIRLFYRLTQTELANKLKVTKSQISEIEAGKKNVSQKIIEKYSKAFDIPISSIYLLNEQLENKEDSPQISKKIIDIFRWITSSEDEILPNNLKEKSSPKKSKEYDYV